MSTVSNVDVPPKAAADRAGRVEVVVPGRVEGVLGRGRAERDVLARHRVDGGGAGLGEVVVVDRRPAGAVVCTGGVGGHVGRACGRAARDGAAEEGLFGQRVGVGTVLIGPDVVGHGAVARMVDVDDGAVERRGVADFGRLLLVTGAADGQTLRQPRENASVQRRSRLELIGRRVIGFCERHRLLCDERVVGDDLFTGFDRVSRAVDDIFVGGLRLAIPIRVDRIVPGRRAGG